MSEAYDARYYDSHCRHAEDFARCGVADPYRTALALLEPRGGERILDIGCGRGEILAGCAANDALAIGIDYAREATRIAKEKQARYVLRADAGALPFRRESFDKVSCMEVIEHLNPQQLDACIGEIVRVLKRNGFVLITTPNAWSRILYGLAIVADKIGVRSTWMSRDDPYHTNVQNPRTLRTVLKRYGMTVELFPRIPFPHGTGRKERLKRRFLFLFSHIRCKAYKR